MHVRELSVADRTLKARHGSFVLSQARKGVREALRQAFIVPYGTAGCHAQIVGCAARLHELGPEPPPDDIDRRHPSVVTWHDGDRFYLIASDKMRSAELVRITRSLYERT